MVASAATLRSLARVVRSKNAGPLCLTLDLFFLDEPSYAHAAGSPALSVSAVAALYGLPADQVGLTGQAAFKRFQRDAVAELTRGRQHTQPTLPRTVAVEQSGHGRHSTSSSKGPCCCAP